MQLYHTPTGNVRRWVQDCAGSQAGSCKFPRRTKETRMYSPGGRTGRTPGGVKPILAALVVLMGMGGVALAAPKADQGSPEQAQGNGPAPQAQDPAPPPQAQANGPAPQAQNPAPPPQAKVKGQQGAAKPVAAPPPQPPQPGGGSNPGQSRRSGAGHGRPVPGELRGLGLGRSNRGNCQSAACRGGAPKPSAAASGDQPQPA